jgi:ABC-type antimicrobial peptide transport system permease subunit
VTVGRPRLYAVLLDLFAAVGLTLAIVGVFGVTTSSVVQRTREIGVRMALGADQGRVVRMVLGQGLRLTLVGGLVGFVLSGAVAMGLASAGILFGIRPLDPVAFGGTALLLAPVATLAT